MTRLRKRGLLWFAACCLALIGSLTFAGSASAHAVLVSSSPAPSSVLDASPTEILLTFDETVDVVVDSIRLVDANGGRVAIGQPGHRQGTSSIGVSVPALPDGTYIVAWQAISADSHPISGAFTFSVRSQTRTAPGLVDRLLAGQGPDRVNETGLAIGRWLSYGGVALLIGLFVIVARCDPESLARRRTASLLVLAAAGGAVGTAAMVAFQGALAGYGLLSPSGWRFVAESRAGRWWVVRLALFVVGLGLAWIARRFRRDGWWPVAVVFHTSALLAVTTVGGHAASGRWVPLGFLATFTHLGAMSLWVGGLVAIVFVSPPSRRMSAAAAFSPIALWSVSALAATGTLNAWRQTSTLSTLTGSRYGAWLIIKLVVVAAVVVVAWFARSNLIQPHNQPDDGGDADEPDGSVDGIAAAERSHPLRRLLAVEVAGLAIVLGVTIGLVGSVPPRVAAAAPLSISSLQGTRIAQIVLDPPVTGGTTVHIYLSSTTGSLDTPTSMVVTADLPAQQITGLQLSLQNAGPGHLTGIVDLPVAGEWTIVVTAKYSEFDQVVFRLQAAVR